MIIDDPRRSLGTRSPFGLWRVADLHQHFHERAIQYSPGDDWTGQKMTERSRWPGSIDSIASASTCTFASPGIRLSTCPGVYKSNRPRDLRTTRKAYPTYLGMQPLFLKLESENW